MGVGARVLALVVGVLLAGCEDRVPRPLGGRGTVVAVHEGRLHGAFDGARDFDGPVTAGWVSMGPGLLSIEVWADQPGDPRFATHTLELFATGSSRPAWLLPGYRASVELEGSRPVHGLGDARPFDPDAGVASGVAGFVQLSAARLAEDRAGFGEAPLRVTLHVDEGPRAETLRLSWLATLAGEREAHGTIVVDRPDARFLVGWPAP